MLPPLARTCGRAAVLLWAVLAVSACSGGDGCSRKRDAGTRAGVTIAPGAATQPSVPVAPPSTLADAASQPERAEPARAMPSSEELAVKAAVIEFVLAGEKARAEATARAKRQAPGTADMTVFLRMRKDEEAALLAMLSPHVPPLKPSGKMQIDKGSGEVFDSDTGRPALILSVESVSFTQAPIPRPGPEATAFVGIGEGGWRYGLSKASGRWAVISRYMPAVW